MGTLTNKIDFIALVTVNMANANGDPLNGNRPRTDYNGYGEMSTVCVKRKMRNRMQDMGHAIFVQSNDRCEDGYTSLQKRAEAVLGKTKDESEYAERACKTWLDVRAFGQVFAFGDSNKEKDKGVSVGVRGPVTIHEAISVSPVEIHSLQITKSVNGKESKNRASDTMGMTHMVRFGLYQIKGSINVQLAEKTGFSEEDTEILKQCLLTLFENDASSARPEGSMEVYRLYWWQHNCKAGQYSSAKVHRSLKIIQKDPDKLPDSVDDYEITLEELPGLVPEVLDGR